MDDTDVRRLALEQRRSGVRKGQFDIDIINAVRERPELYDKAHENHKNPAIKELEWKRIAHKLQVPPGYVIKRWTVIRERFAAEKRKVLPLGPSAWWLMDHMKWLDAHIQPRQSKSKIFRLDGMPISRNSTPSQAGYYEGDDDRCGSPLLPIAYPEVLMEPSSPPNSSCNSNDGDHNVDRDRLPPRRRETHVSDESYSEWVHPILDVDESAAARVLAALRTIDDRSLRHQFRRKFHQLAEECEAAGIGNWSPKEA